jgi:hypothetical protein
MKSAMSNFSSFNNKTKKSAIAGGSGVNQKTNAKKFSTIKKGGKSLTTKKLRRINVRSKSKSNYASGPTIRTGGW